MLTKISLDYLEELRMIDPNVKIAIIVRSDTLELEECPDMDVSDIDAFSINDNSISIDLIKTSSST